MHTYIQYDIENDPEGAAKKALRDVKKWIGTRRFNRLVEQFRLAYAGRLNEENPPEHFSVAWSFAGVEGYPVKVVWDHIRKQ